MNSNLSGEKDKKSELYEKLFPLEIQSWYESLKGFSGEPSNDLLYDILSFVHPSFEKAIYNSISFDIVDISYKFSSSVKFIVDSRTVTLKILCALPDPKNLNENQQYALAIVLDNAEKKYRGVISYMERNWSIRRKYAKQPTQ